MYSTSTAYGGVWGHALESVHDGDHDGVVRIFIGLSCKLFFMYNVHCKDAKGVRQIATKC